MVMVFSSSDLQGRLLALVLEKTCCPEQIEFITEDHFSQHMNITIIYN